MFLQLLGFLLVTSLRGIGGQKIVAFTSFVQNNSCTVPNVAREHQDKFFIVAVLQLELASAQDWWAFVLQSPNERYNETLSLVRVDECEPGEPPNFSKMHSDTSLCWKQGRSIFALFALGVIPKYNNSFFSGVWSKESSGSITTSAPYIRLRTVDPDDERVEVNGIVHATNDKYMVIQTGAMFSVRYCVRNVGPHQLGVFFEDMKELSTGDCVMLNSTVKEFKTDEQIFLLLKETEGQCKRYIQRSYIIVKERRQEEKTFFQSVNGAHRIVLLPCQCLLVVTGMWVLSLVY